MTTVPNDLPGSLFCVMTGQTNTGKTEQAQRVLRAVAPSGRPAVAPGLVLLAEASTEGTAGAFLADPASCLVWPVGHCTDAKDVLHRCFPEGRQPLSLGEARALLHTRQSEEARAAGRPPPPPVPTTERDAWPLRSVAVESISTLLTGQQTLVREMARNDPRARRSKTAVGQVSVSGQDLENDRKRQAAIAAGPALDLVDALSGVCARHRGLCVVVSCHARPQMAAVTTGEPPNVEVREVCVGEAPDFGAPKTIAAGLLAAPYAALWDHLARRANIIWHMFRKAPDLRSVAADEVNDVAAGAVEFGAITQAGRYSGLGDVLWPKRQGGDGWLGWFDALPRCWSPSVPWGNRDGFLRQCRDLGLPSLERYQDGPDLGLVLELCLAEHAAASRTC